MLENIINRLENIIRNSEYSSSVTKELIIAALKDVINDLKMYNDLY